MADLEIEALHLSLGGNHILKGLSATFHHGEIVALLGPSGSGKTTLLRAIAGLEKPSAGRIRLDGKSIFDAGKSTDLAPEKRGVGFVFQSYALWPHKTIFENIAYGLRVRKMPSSEIVETVEQILADVGLAGFSQRYPSQLSGGQQQRIALARTLVYSPPLILLDEPLSNLDAKLREEARIWIHRLIKSLGLTAVFVTHDQVEAMALADRIVLLEGGKIIQTGSPEELYTRPRTFFVADFMGANNVIDAVCLTAGGELKYTVDALGSRLRAAACEVLEPGAPVKCVIRIGSVGIADSPGENRCQAALAGAMYLGGHWELIFDVGGATIRAHYSERLPNGSYWLDFPVDHLWAFNQAC